LNNAGYGAAGPLEAFDMASIRRQFETKVIGLLAVTKAVLPWMRMPRSGMIVNISAVGGRSPLVHTRLFQEECPRPSSARSNLDKNAHNE
jgi:short-subunit dehydrogenase